MHIELTEMLRCTAPHPPAALVLSTGAMRGRRVLSGLVGCPVCRREYPIVDGVVDFGAASGPEPTGAPPDPAALQALLDLSGPGGVVVLVGGAVRDAPGLAARIEGVHLIGVNPPAAARESNALSLLRAPGFIPLGSALARGVVLGADVAAAPWLAEGVRVLLPGRRLVAEREGLEPPAGIRFLAAGDGLWVGEKA